MVRARLLYLLLWVLCGDLFFTETPNSFAQKTASKKAKSRPKTKARRARKRKRKRGLNTIGDTMFLVDVGARLFSLNTATGEVTTKTIGERDVFHFRLHLGYGYFLSNSMLVILSLPLELEVNPIVSGLYSVSMSVGVRQYFGRWLFAEGHLLLARYSSAEQRFLFGGFLFGGGFSIPMGPRLRLSGIMQVPFNFFDGIQTGVNVLIGVNVLF